MWLGAHGRAAERGRCWLEPTGRKSREHGLGDGGRQRTFREDAGTQGAGPRGSGWRGGDPRARLEFCVSELGSGRSMA